MWIGDYTLNNRKNSGIRFIVKLIPAMVLCISTAYGQVIDTNRPGFSFTPGVVPEGQWQLETGISYDRANSNSSTTSLPLAELRFGLANNVEVFVSSLSWSDSESGANDSRGFVDAIIGTKIGLGSGKARTAVVLQLSVPVGDSELTSDDWDPAAAFVWAYDSRIPVAGTVKVTYLGDRFQLDNGLKLPLAVNDRQSAFVEWEANLPDGGDDAHWLNGGYQWLLSDRSQIDINAGTGLNDTAGDYRLGMGFAISF